MSYLVLFDDPGFRVASETLRSALERDWPELAFEPGLPATVSQVRDVVWTYERGAEQVEGHSHVDGTCIYLEGSVHLAAEFAIWYRKLVPPTIEVLFCDEGYTFTTTVLPENPAVELAARAEAGE